MAIQVNGKVRGTMDISVTALEADAMSEAMKQASVTKYTSDATIKKVVYVPGRILNIIVSK
jgi:leucyl-tRNA synthetase